ncbi:unnamed protein product [Onchocerca flexuosa]|uniref:Uncharacterized protein n=1 Tax=Onchocerca flexuosa TaxID=387005 RepID=A0A183HX01_9BILA|nr:unnamed protein product [Onchocerca flexuosa]
MIPSIYGQLASTGTIADPLVQAAAAALAAQSAAAAAATASATDTFSTTDIYDMIELRYHCDNYVIIFIKHT